MTTIFKSRCHRQHLMIPRLECLLVFLSLFLPHISSASFCSFVFSSFLLSHPFYRVFYNYCILVTIRISNVRCSNLNRHSWNPIHPLLVRSNSVFSENFSLNQHLCHFPKSMFHVCLLASLNLNIWKGLNPTLKWAVCQAWESCSAVVALKQHNQCARIQAGSRSNNIVSPTLLGSITSWVPIVSVFETSLTKKH